MDDCSESRGYGKRRLAAVTDSDCVSTSTTEYGYVGITGIDKSQGFDK